MAQGTTDTALIGELIDHFGEVYLKGPGVRRKILIALGHQIAKIDDKLNQQVNTILHDEHFQELEAIWRGARYLVESYEDSNSVVIKVLDISWAELEKDFDRAIEVDQSEIFSKIYQKEFGMPGGEPFGVLIGNYTISHSVKHTGRDDIDILSKMASVAAASFAPFIINAHPSLFELSTFRELNSFVNLDRTFQQKSYLKWKSFRSSEDARFVGITLPSILIRRPYVKTPTRKDKFLFAEKHGNSIEQYLWIGSCFAFASVLGRNFRNSGWLSHMTGVGREGGGIVFDTPKYGSDVDGQEKMSAEVLISDDLEREISEHGFIPLTYTTNSPVGVFYSASSAQTPKAYLEDSAHLNSRYSSMLQYIFCTSRFAHYLKVIVREKIGSFISAEECKNYLQRWIMSYVTTNDEDDEILRIRFPLRAAKISVHEKDGVAGSFLCVAHIKPHFQLESIETSVQFVAEVVPNRVTG